MTLRFCVRCSADVETSDGFCLLGHSVKLVPPAGAPVSDGPAEALTTGPPPPPPDRLGGAPSLGRFGALWRKEENDGLDSDPIASFAPYPRMDWGPRRPWRRRAGKAAGD